MQQTQINRLEMFESTNSYLDNHAGVWGAIPIVGNYKNGLNQAILDIKEAALKQEQAQVFIAQSLRQLKHQIAVKMDILDDVLEAYADDTNNEELKMQAANSSTDYYRLPHEEFETKTLHVIALLEENVDAMGDYGISNEQIEDVKLNFNEFQTHRGKPRAYKIASRAATQSIDELFREAQMYTNKLDKVIKRFKHSDPMFFNGYQAARKVVDD